MISLSRSQASIDRQVGQARRALIDEINATIGAQRQAYITTLPGQEMIYGAKEAEAKAYLAADPEPSDLTDYPFLAAEVGVTAETAYQLAQVWLYMAHEWRTVGPQMEHLRLSLISDADAATTMVEIEQVRAAHKNLTEGTQEAQQ